MFLGFEGKRPKLPVLLKSKVSLGLRKITTCLAWTTVSLQLKMACSKLPIELVN